MTADATRLRRALERWPARVAANAAPIVEREIRGDRQLPDGPLREGGPKLRNVIRATAGPPALGRGTVHVRAPAIQASTVEKGARPHVIVPRRPGGVLRFPVGGRVVFARKVNHPGNAPRPYWRGVLERAWSKALRDAARRTPL